MAGDDGSTNDTGSAQQSSGGPASAAPGAGGSAAADAGWCGACGNTVSASDRAPDACTFCGRALIGDTADRLRVIARRRHELEMSAMELRREVRALDDERIALMRA